MPLDLPCLAFAGSDGADYRQGTDFIAEDYEARDYYEEGYGFAS